MPVKDTPVAEVREALVRRRAASVALSTTLLDHIERAAVTASSLADTVERAEPATTGVTLTLCGVVDQLRSLREIVLREQPDLVDGYADALRRAEGRS